MKSHTFSLRVYFEDTDAAGIVYHPNYLKFAERARTEYLRDIGFDHADCLKKNKTAFVVSKCDIDFKATAFLDDMLNIYTVVEHLKGARLILGQDIYRKEDIIAKMKVELAFIDLETKRPKKIWDIVQESLKVHT